MKGGKIRKIDQRAAEMHGINYIRSRIQNCSIRYKCQTHHIDTFIVQTDTINIAIDGARDRQAAFAELARN